MTRNIRPIRVKGQLAYVPLTKGYEAVIDASDVHLVEGFNWCAVVRRYTVYAVRGERSAERAGASRRNISLHRVIVGGPDGLQVDHCDGNGLNNRRCNLRVATAAQNQQNARKRSDNTTGLKGVDWHKRDRKWRARIVANGKRKHLGLYHTAEEAYAAYCAASEKYHKEFGRTQ